MSAQLLAPALSALELPSLDASLTGSAASPGASAPVTPVDPGPAPDIAIEVAADMLGGLASRTGSLSRVALKTARTAKQMKKAISGFHLLKKLGSSNALKSMIPTDATKFSGEGEDPEGHGHETPSLESSSSVISAAGLLCPSNEPPRLPETEVYNMPNVSFMCRPGAASSSGQPAIELEELTRAPTDETLPPVPHPPSADAKSPSPSHFVTLSTSIEVPISPFPVLPTLTPPVVLRVILFLPWCILVGAVIALQPSQLDHVVFRTGYVNPPRTSLHRLAYYAHCAVPHVGIFAGALLALTMWDRRVAAAVTAIVAARAFSLWWNFDHENVMDDSAEDMRCVWFVVSGREEMLVAGVAVDSSSE
ncbi:hypothetical protein FA95DRAFT_1604726 [Auriscalpium vulgare]|uniref:Uncharacterized protein n=1 Tax=Auriscalpium vulgare TaxID=40419 RepID=A0ACB8RYT1_9AGAM|nr:hypothetical protein FA95DRAFT_1604726 [Auriscalpium vulgare]